MLKTAKDVINAKYKILCVIKITLRGWSQTAGSLLALGPV